MDGDPVGPRRIVRFRDATEADLPAIVALLADDTLGAAREDVGPPLPPAYTSGFWAIMAQGGRIVLAVDAGEIIGCLQLNLLPGVALRGLLRAEVESVRVAAARRGGGVGASLMQEAVRQAREAGAGMMQLTTNLVRIDAQRFYERLGFARSHAGMKLVL